MNEALADRELFSATLADDARIRRIFDAAKTAPEFALRKSDAEEIIAELARLRRLPPAALARAKREAEVMSLTGLRAEAKARYLATFWAMVAWRNSSRADRPRPQVLTPFKSKQTIAASSPALAPS